MVQTIGTKMTGAEFLTLPASDGRYELIAGEVVLKVSPKRFHAGTQKALLMLRHFAWERGPLARSGSGQDDIAGALLRCHERLNDDKSIGCAYRVQGLLIMSLPTRPAADSALAVGSARRANQS